MMDYLPIIISSIGLVISAISVACAIYFSHKNSKKTDVREIEQRVAENTRINVKLDTINSATQEIKDQLSSLVKEVQAHGERLIKVEENCKTLKDRVDAVEHRLNKEECDHER